MLTCAIAGLTNCDILYIILLCDISWHLSVLNGQSLTCKTLWCWSCYMIEETERFRRSHLQTDVNSNLVIPKDLWASCKPSFEAMIVFRVGGWMQDYQRFGLSQSIHIFLAGFTIWWRRRFRLGFLPAGSASWLWPASLQIWPASCHPVLIQKRWSKHKSPFHIFIKLSLLTANNGFFISLLWINERLKKMLGIPFPLWSKVPRRLLLLENTQKYPLLLSWYSLRLETKT